MTIHRAIPFPAYRALPGWNWSLIKELTKSPLHLAYARNNPDDGDTDSRIQLRLNHTLILEPERFADEYHIWDGTRNNGTQHKAVQIGNYGKTIIKSSWYEKSKATADAVRAHPRVAELLDGAETELSLTWTCPRTGLDMKGRLDICKVLSDRVVIGDCKEIGSTDPLHVDRLIAKHLWHGQGAHYEEGVRQNFGDLPIEYLIVAMEGKKAQDVVVRRLSAHPPHGFLHLGRELRASLLDRLAECIAADSWPGVSDQIEDAVPPSYLVDDDDIYLSTED